MKLILPTVRGWKIKKVQSASELSYIPYSIIFCFFLCNILLVAKHF
jgi:hypothetical protein